MKNKKWVMNIDQALTKAVQQLNKQKIKTAQLDAEILLSHAINQPKEYLYSRPKKKLAKNQLQKFNSYIKRRAKHEPVAYITGHKEFYGLDFLVNKHVLIPRPETELLVEETLKIFSQLSTVNCQLLEIGTGSGCIAISLAKHLPKIEITAIDSSKQALQVARQNAHHLQVSQQIKFIRGNVFELKKIIIHYVPTCLRASNLIIANLPYIPTSEYTKLPPDIKKYEPKSALIAGHDGLKYYRQLFKQLKNYQLPTTNYQLIIEIGHNQSLAIKKLIQQYLPKTTIKFKKDLAGKNRIAIIKNTRS